MLLFFFQSFDGQNPLGSLLSGGAWTAYAKLGASEQAFMLQIGNCSMGGGRGAMPGFGLVERPSSMVSRCKRRKPPILAWDNSSSDCPRLTLTYDAGHAPDSIFGFFVIPISQNEQNSTLAAGGQAQYKFGQKVEGEWRTYPFRATEPKSDAPTNMVSQTQDDCMLFLGEGLYVLAMGWPAMCV